jgi:glutathione-regulated potassium-efflux system ancillary protein KefC
MDVIDNEGNPVLIAGFGRCGQIVARLLHAHRIGTTIIDNNPDHIERVRRFGYKAYYGDARRLDLLETAGIGQARLLVLALDDRDATVDVARRVGERHPGLTVLARAYDRPHAFRLLDLGIGNFVRETFHSALEMGEQALQHLGFDEQSASRAAATMADHDHRMLFDMYAVRGDEDRMISVAQAARRALQRTLEGDREDRRFQSECERTAVAAGDGGDAVV